MGNRLIVFLVLCFNITFTHANTYGPVKAGDILWHIAAQVAPNANRYQAMLGLLKSNPQAFSVSCNVNSLKIGAVLQAPSPELIQAVSSREAVAIINTQFTAWKSRRTTPIICEPITEIQTMTAIDTQTEQLNVIPTLKIPAQTQVTPTVAAPPIIESMPEPILEKALKMQKLPEPSQLAEKMLKTPLEPEQSLMTSSPALMDMIKNNFKLLIITGGILAIFVLLLITILIWLVYRLSNRKPISQPEQHSTVFSRVHEPKTEQQITENDDNDIKDKLAVIRTCLAEGEEAVQILLKDVLEKGSDTQQHEARQLIEINRKIHKLEQYQHVDDLQQVAKMSQYLPQNSFAPENQQQVFTLIDKIFELLDHELNANGELVEAYTQRHQTEFYNQNMRPEKVLVEKHTQHSVHSHPTDKATRYL